MQNTRIRDFLAQGLSPLQVMQIVGCTPEYMNSLIKDEEFKLSVQEAAKIHLESASEDVVISNKRLAVEHLLLKQIETLATSGEMKDVVNAYKVVSDANAKGASVKKPDGNTFTGNFLMLTLPSHAMPEYRVNESNEVVSIAGKPLAPMSADSVKSLLVAHQDNMRIAKEY